MPTKGRSRGHEAIRLRPAGHSETTVVGPAGGAGGSLWQDTTDTDPGHDQLAEHAARGAEGGGGAAQSGPGDGPDDVTERCAGCDHARARHNGQGCEQPDCACDLAFGGDPAPDAGPNDDEPVAWRTYRGEHTQIAMPNASALRQQLRSASGDPRSFEANVALSDPDAGAVAVTGTATAQWLGGPRYDVTLGDLSCDACPEDCQHRRQAGDAIQALLEGRRIRTSLAEWERTTHAVEQALAADHQASEAARQTPANRYDGPGWVEDPAEFQAAYRAARTAAEGGVSPVPYMTENATDGLGARDGGRPFGVEIEFDLGSDVTDRYAAMEAIGRDLHAAGITPGPRQTAYHSNRGDYSNWRFENDSTVDGEIVSPILYDEPATWTQLAQVCEIVRRHGGTATARTGGHVHVGVSDFDHTVENHNNLLGMFSEHEDDLYRLAQNPARRAHRGQSWCTPNRVPAAGYDDIVQVHHRNNSHNLGLNFGGVRGQETDHVEFRMWDGSLDPAVIQTQINLSLGLTHAALRAERGTSWESQPIGLHRQSNSDLRRGDRLSGDRWRADTESFRRLMDRIFAGRTNRGQATALFAVTRWQRRT